MSFVSETSVKAVRKRHRCDGCGGHIDVGQPATRWSGVVEGDFSTAIYHPDCREAEIAMNNDIRDFQYGDDWRPLDEIEHEDWPWLRDAYPAVAGRLGIAETPPEDGSQTPPASDGEGISEGDTPTDPPNPEGAG